MHAQSGPRQSCQVVPRCPPERTPLSRDSKRARGLSSASASKTSTKSRRRSASKDSRSKDSPGGLPSSPSPRVRRGEEEAKESDRKKPFFVVKKAFSFSGRSDADVARVFSVVVFAASFAASSSSNPRKIPAPSPVSRRRCSCVFCALKSPATKIGTRSPNRRCRSPTAARTHRALSRFAGQSSIQSWPASRCTLHTITDKPRFVRRDERAASIEGGARSIASSLTQVNGIMRAPHRRWVSPFTRARRVRPSTHSNWPPSSNANASVSHHTEHRSHRAPRDVSRATRVATAPGASQNGKSSFASRSVAEEPEASPSPAPGREDVGDGKHAYRVGVGLESASPVADDDERAERAVVISSAQSSSRHIARVSSCRHRKCGFSL